MKSAAIPPRSLASPPPVISSNVPVKPAEEDRIEPAQSAYSPVSLPAPKKLKNPFAAMEQQSQQTFSSSTSPSGGAKKLTWSERQALAKKRAEEEEQQSQQTLSPSASSPSGGAKKLTWSERQALAKKRAEEEEQQSQQTFSPSTPTPSGGAKKLTWSERQALAKKRAEEEEAESRSASTVPSAVVSPISKPDFKSSAPNLGRATAAQSAPRNFGPVGAAAGVGAVAGATVAFSARSIPPAPVAAPSSYISARDAVQDAAWGEEEEVQTAVAEPEPASEPEPQYQPEPEEPQYQAVSIYFLLLIFPLNKCDLYSRLLLLLLLHRLLHPRNFMYGSQSRKWLLRLHRLHPHPHPHLRPRPFWHK